MAGREDTPSLGIIDSKSIKSSHHVVPDRGIDGNKKLKGRKEHIVVDTLGLPMGVVVHEADIHDSVGAHPVIDAMQGCFPRLKKILADGGYKGQKLIDTVKQKLGAEFTVVLRPDESSKKFNVLPLYKEKEIRRLSFYLSSDTLFETVSPNVQAGVPPGRHAERRQNGHIVLVNHSEPTGMLHHKGEKYGQQYAYGIK